MNKNLLSRLSLSLFLLIFSVFLDSSPLRVIDKTWQVVSEEYKKFSIIHGAILWETNWLYNFYRFANFYPIKTIDRRGREVISYDPAKTDNVIKTAHTLFYLVPGSTSPTDFSTTDFMNTSDPKKIALLGAQILVSLEGLATSKTALEDAYPKLKKQIEILQNSVGVFNPVDKPIIERGLTDLQVGLEQAESSGDKTKLLPAIKNLFTSSKSKFAALVVPELSQPARAYLTANKQMDSFLTPAKALLKLSATTLLKISATDFAKIVIGALQECDGTYYPKDLVYYIWEGFLFGAINKACKSDVSAMREAFQIYYQELSRLLEITVELPTEISLPENVNFREAIQKTKELIDNPENAVNELDSFLFWAKNSQPIPDPVTFATITHKHWSFSDCMENSIANFIRAISYDSTTGVSNTETLERHLGIKITGNAKERLDQFFKNSSGHTYWASLVSNLPYVPYRQIGSEGGKAVKENPNSIVIRLNPEDLKKNPDLKQKYETAGYTVIDENQAAFEIRASGRAIIIVLDYILDLHLFDENGGLAKEGLATDFVSYYFPDLVEALHMEGYYALISPSLTDPDVLDKEKKEKMRQIEIDKIDTTRKETVYYLLASQIKELGDQFLSHIFTIHSGHGQYSFGLLGKESEILKFKSVNTMYSSFQRQGRYLFDISLILSNLLHQDHYTPIDLSRNNILALYALPLHNADYVSRLIGVYDQIFDRIRDFPDFRMKTEQLLFNLIQSVPDTSLRLSFFEKIASFMTIGTDNLKRLEIESVRILKDSSLPPDDSINAALLLNSLIRHRKIDKLSAEKILHELLNALPKIKYFPSANTVIVDFISRYPNEEQLSQIKSVIRQNAEQSFAKDLFSSLLQSGIIASEESK